MSRLFQGSLLVLLCANLALGVFGVLHLGGAAREQQPSAGDPASYQAESARGEEGRPVSMFSWEDEPYRLAERPRFYTVLDELSITRVYQSFADESLYSEEALSFLDESARAGRAVYYLTGAPEWGLEPKAGNMILQIRKVASFNRASASGTFAGILMDAEPYLTDEWDQDEEAAMQSYLAATKTAYTEAQRLGVRMILCIPYWLDSSHADKLEEMIAHACDGVAVMNYNRDAEAESIRTEVELAKKYGKEIECIYEFQEPGRHSLTENETYYSLGLAAARARFAVLYEQLDYDRLSLSYHYYKPVQALLDQEWEI